MRLRLRHLLAPALAGVASLPSVQAQVASDEVVVSTFYNPSVNGPGGLWLVHEDTGAVTQVTGLGADLTGAGAVNYTGANSVQIGPADELYVGEVGPQGTAIDLHTITLSGSAVVSDTTCYLGNQGSPYTGGVTQTALLPDGRVLVGVFGIDSGPLAGFELGIVDPSTCTVTGVPAITNKLPALNALCLGPDGQLAYFAVDTGVGSSYLFSVPVPGGGQATYCTTLCASVSNLVLDEPGNRLLACAMQMGSCAGAVIEIDLATCTQAPCATGLTALNGLTPDGHGDLFAVTGTYGTPPTSLFAVGAPPNCSASLITNGPIGGWGTPSGLDHPRRCGQVYCDANPANAADIAIDGCSCAAGSLNVTLSGAPAQQFAYLLVGAANGTATDPPGAQGDLCLVGAPIGRYAKDAGQTDAAGSLGTDIFNSLSGGGGGGLPNPPGGNLCVPSGQTWNFQYWHRDGMNPSKFSKALTVTFQ